MWEIMLNGPDQQSNPATSLLTGEAQRIGSGDMPPGMKR